MDARLLGLSNFRLGIKDEQAIPRYFCGITCAKTKFTQVSRYSTCSNLGSPSKLVPGTACDAGL